MNHLVYPDHKQVSLICYTITYSELMKFSFVHLNFKNENTNHSKNEGMTLTTLMYKEYPKQLAVFCRYHLICKIKGSGLYYMMCALVCMLTHAHISCFIT